MTKRHYKSVLSAWVGWVADRPAPDAIGILPGRHGTFRMSAESSLKNKANVRVVPPGRWPAHAACFSSSFLPLRKLLIVLMERRVLAIARKGLMIGDFTTSDPGKRANLPGAPPNRASSTLTPA